MSDLAEIAYELARAGDDAELYQCAFAFELEALAAGARRARFEVLAARIGLSDDATRKVLDDCERRAKLMRAGAAIIGQLMAADARLHDRRA